MEGAEDKPAEQVWRVGGLWDGHATTADVKPGRRSWFCWTVSLAF